MMTATQQIQDAIENNKNVSFEKETKVFGFFRLNNETTVRVHKSDFLFEKLMEVSK